MRNPIAVLISDIHYDIHTLSLADAATRQAVAKANSLRIPLIIAGDLHNTKALHRAECQEAMLKTFSQCWQRPVILIGNHDRRNEKSHEHSLHFLNLHAHLVTEPILWSDNPTDSKITLIPYQHSGEDFIRALGWFDNPTVICHQGVVDADMGHYAQDRSAVIKMDVRDHRVISGHYHKRQDIKCGRPRKGAVGLFSYIGNPYTLTYGEANDPEKGFQVLYDDGTLEFVPTKLRKHVVVDCTAAQVEDPMFVGPEKPQPNDLIWLKVRGTQAELSQYTKEYLGSRFFGHTNFRYDPIRTDVIIQSTLVENMNSMEAMDTIIDSTQDTSLYKTELKRLYRELMDEDSAV